jgi:hypothetical protein
VGKQLPKYKFVSFRMRSPHGYQLGKEEIVISKQAVENRINT